MTIKQVRKIKSLMMLKGITGKEIARRERVSMTWVSLVLNGRAPSERIRRAIAEALRVSYESIWGKECKPRKVA
jgi:transcriptional regulator with XRE-family HTH domain